MKKPVFGVSDQVRHKPGCTTTEDGWRLEISDLGSRGIVLSICENKDADQLLCFRICINLVFSRRGSNGAADTGVRMCTELWLTA